MITKETKRISESNIMYLKNSIEIMDAEKAGLIVLQQDDIDKIHMNFIEMLSDFDRICSDNQIRWVLAGGSMLGAVRHQGFIPWDDDVDIHMTRSEFNKLVKYFRSFPQNKYELAVPGDENYFFHYPHIYKKGTKFKEILSNGSSKDELFMDIFLIEDTYDSKIKRFFHGLECTFYLGIVSTLRVNACKELLLKYTENEPSAKKAIQIRSFLSLFFKYRNITEWIKKADECFSKANNPNSKYICIPSGAKHYFGELYERNWFKDQKKVRFENLILPIPNEAEKILEQRYGSDYMQIPLQKNRAKHAIIQMKL